MLKNLIAWLVLLAQVQREMSDNQVAAHNINYNKKPVTLNARKFLNNECRLLHHQVATVVCWC
jgi:hypothetical protein